MGVDFDMLEFTQAHKLPSTSSYTRSVVYLPVATDKIAVAFVQSRSSWQLHLLVQDMIDGQDGVLLYSIIHRFEIPRHACRLYLHGLGWL